MAKRKLPPPDPQLRKAFRERYLDSQHAYLGSISDLIIFAYSGSGHDYLTKRARAIADRVDLSCAVDIAKLGQGSKSKALSNLTNAWYNECALCYPDTEDPLERMTWAAWKIVQFFYSIFMSLSAAVRCFQAPTKQLGQEAMIDIFTTRVLDTRRFRSAFVLFPFNVYLNSRGNLMRPTAAEVDWWYAESFHIPNVQKALVWAKTRRPKKTTSIFHYFRDLREWAQYEDPYLMARLYGPTIAEQLDRALTNIVFAWLMIAELWVSCAYGQSVVIAEANRFCQLISTLRDFEATNLLIRLAVLQDTTF